MSVEEIKKELKRKLSLNEAQVAHIKEENRNKRSKFDTKQLPNKKEAKQRKALKAMKQDLTFQKPKAHQTPEEEKEELELLESFMFSPSAVVPRDLVAILKMKLEEKQQDEDISVEEESTLRRVDDLPEAWQDDDEQEFELKLRATTSKQEENKNEWLKFYDSAKEIEVSQSNMLSNEMIPQRKLTYQNVKTVAGKEFKRKKRQNIISGVQFHPNGQLFFSVQGNHLYINEIAPFFEKIARAKNARVKLNDSGYNLADIALVRRVKIFGTSTETAYINSLVITPNGEDLYIGGTVGLIAYNVENDELTHPRTSSFISHDNMNMNAVKKLVCSPNGLYLAILLSNVNTVRIFDIANKLFRDEITVGPVLNDLCFTPDSKYFYLCCNDGNLLIYETTTAKFIQKRAEVGALSVTCMAISPNGRYLAIGNSSGIVNLYNGDHDITNSKEKPKLLKTLYNFNDSIANLLFNPHGQILAMFSDTFGKFLHLSSMTVYQEFTLTTINLTKNPIKYYDPVPTFQAFSKDSQYWARTDSNRVNLYKFPFYGKHSF